MVAAMPNQRLRPQLSDSPIDWRMDIELHEGGNNGHLSDRFDSRNSAGPLRFRLSQPCDEAVDFATTVLLVRELQQRINALMARVECLENRLPTPHLTGQVLDADAERTPTQDEFEDPNDVADTEPEQVGRDDGGLILADLARGPLAIDVVAAALGKPCRSGSARHRRTG